MVKEGSSWRIMVGLDMSTGIRDKSFKVKVNTEDKHSA